MPSFCRHRNQTVPFRDERGAYRRCLSCGGRIPWRELGSGDVYFAMRRLQRALQSITAPESEQVEDLERLYKKLPEGKGWANPRKSISS